MEQSDIDTADEDVCTTLGCQHYGLPLMRYEYAPWFHVCFCVECGDCVTVDYRVDGTIPPIASVPATSKRYGFDEED